MYLSRCPGAGRVTAGSREQSGGQSGQQGGARGGRGAATVAVALDQLEGQVEKGAGKEDEVEQGQGFGGEEVGVRRGGFWGWEG